MPQAHRTPYAKRGGFVAFGGQLPNVIAPELIESLVTTTQAANLAGVKVATISMWKERGHLTPAMTDHRGRPLYRWIDVARAEHATRQRARRTYAA